MCADWHISKKKAPKTFFRHREIAQELLQQYAMWPGNQND